MPKTRHQAAAIGGTADDIEAALYEALQTGDIEKLMACWADEDEIVCVHPGGPRVVGALAIRATFDAMFSNGPISAVPQRVRKVESLASAVHNVLERIDVMTPDGPQQAWVMPPTSITRPRRAGAWWCTTPAPARPASCRKWAMHHRCFIDSRCFLELHRPLVAARRQPADDLAGALCAPRVGPATGLPARAVGHTGRRLH
jgi:ketosteroid isomerase-like protein